MESADFWSLIKTASNIYSITRFHSVHHWTLSSQLVSHSLMQSHLGINRCLLYFGTWELDMTADWRSSNLKKYEWVILTLIEHSQALVTTWSIFAAFAFCWSFHENSSHNWVDGVFERHLQRINWIVNCTWEQSFPLEMYYERTGLTLKFINQSTDRFVFTLQAEL